MGSAVDFEVAAEQGAAVGCEAGIDSGAERAYRGDDAYAEGEAEEDDPEAADAASEFPAGESEGEHHCT